MNIFPSPDTGRRNVFVQILSCRLPSKFSSGTVTDLYRIPQETQKHRQELGRLYKINKEIGVILWIKCSVI